MRARWISRAPGASKLGAVGLAVICAAAAPIAVSASTAHAENGAPSAARVNTRFIVADATREAQTGRLLAVRGSLRPARAAEKVSLLVHEQGGWRTVGHALTHRSGRFTVSEVLGSPGAHMARVTFAGNSTAQPTSTRVGPTVGLTPEVASWYYDQGDTACGFHATYGVANRTLPCGSRVRLRYDGRSVTATVDDRGPYVSGRTFDLDQTTARSLGISGVATVLAS